MMIQTMQNKLRKTTAFFSVVLLVSVTALADVGVWKVSDKDTTLYLMGTIHILPKGTEWETDLIKKAMAESETVVLELHPDDTTPAKMVPLVQKYGFFPAGETIKDHLDDETYKALKAKWGSNPAAWAQVERMRPWYLSVVITVQTLQANGFDPNSGVEKVLENQAKASKKSLAGLENAEYQIKALATLDSVNKGGLLKELLAELPKLTETTNKMVDAWQAGDMEALGVLINDDMMQYPEVYEALITARNKNWITEIKTMLASPKTQFIAVGAGHLTGKDNVIGLLKAENITVERIQ